MARQHNTKREQLQEILKESSLETDQLLQEFCTRFCQPPFPRTLGSAPLWIEIWPRLYAQGREMAFHLPDPCLNHIESRMRKTERAEVIRSGILRLLNFDQTLFLEGLRLYPHAVCRTAEAIGPLAPQKWEEVLEDLEDHRLFQDQGEVTEENFWNIVDRLIDFRELPQPVLDYVDLDRPRKEAPLDEFIAQSQRFLLRRKIEKLRGATYENLRVHGDTRVIEAGTTP